MACPKMSCNGSNHPPLDQGMSPSPPFRGEREGPAKQEGEVGGAANRSVGPPHPALSPRPAGGEDKIPRFSGGGYAPERMERVRWH
jgi:hypothetical protein